MAITPGRLDKNSPLNAFRYQAKRYDSGSGSINMGARSFNPGSDSFLQPDVYYGALDNLALGARRRGSVQVLYRANAMTPL